jgi:type IV secretion system protein VirB6
MACPAVITGDAFVTRVLLHIDCQAQYLGSYGYLSLAQPGSVAAVVVSGLLTLFVALWGIRLLLGPTPAARDLVLDTLKVGIVLALAFSWPAFRTIVHDVVLTGPAEIASAITSPGLASTGAGFIDRLQSADNAITLLTEAGTGRDGGQLVDPDREGTSFAAVGLQDESTFGYGRLAFLVGMFGPLAILRLGAGLLLAIAPLAAGLLLFEQTRGLFSGWFKGLAFVVLGVLAVTFSLALELAMLEPWLTDALRVRDLGYATPTAPTELLAMTLAFALVHSGIAWFAAKVCFNNHWVQRLSVEGKAVDLMPRSEVIHQSIPIPPTPNRAEALARSVDIRVRQERLADDNTRMPTVRENGGPTAPETRSFGGAVAPLQPAGTSSARRTNPRDMRRGQSL